MSVTRTWFESTANLVPSRLPPPSRSRNAESRSSSRSTSTSQKLHSRTPSRLISTHDETLSILQRSEASVRRQLQLLLDAQAEGLTAGIVQQEDGSQSSQIGSISDSTPSPRHGKVIPIRQPTRKPMSLRSARRGIRIAMLELADIKDRELESSKDALHDTEHDLEQIRTCTDRQRGLEEEVENILQGESSTRIDKLRDEDQALQEQINAIEMQLARLKEEQNSVRSELSKISNSVDSKLSSYQHSLQLLDNQIKEVLHNQTPRASQHDSAYFALAPDRRTLHLAAEHARDEKRALEVQGERLAEERAAVHAGITIWTDAVTAVTDFEAKMRKSMGTLAEDQASSNGDDRPLDELPEEALDLEDLLRLMDEIITNLDDKLRLADARGWKLLVCCIGAELEAFRQGKDILETALSVGRGESSSTGEDGRELVPDADRSDISEAQVAHELMQSSSSTIRQPLEKHQRPLRPYHDEEPDMDLLVSRSDTDPENENE